ncbi:hypothetical protein A9P44_13825 [Paenibacillus polymyxa]|nr:hypothetical protein A9P44_13825 [Paenibacillus polymyxa]
MRRQNHWLWVEADVLAEKLARYGCFASLKPSFAAQQEKDVNTNYIAFTPFFSSFQSFQAI